MKSKLISALAATILISGCQSLSPEELPQSYYDNTPLHSMTKHQRSEYWKRFYANKRQLDKEAACVFGTRPSIDREKLGCEKVKDSPEWKVLNKDS